jgi:Undecaprenyl-phosphate glucose phosphotransferase
LANGVLQPRRVMLVGRRSAISEFNKRLAAAIPDAERLAMRIVAAPDWPDASAFPEISQTVARAVASARTLRPDEVVLVGPWDDPDTVEFIVGAFEQLPIAIHLDGGAVLGRFSDVHLRRVGGTATLSVAELPLSPIQVVLKRGVDIVGASLGLVLAAPLFAIVACAIKRDSAGPVFFRQHRRGFNGEPFEIVKFRTMTTLDNGDVVRQAVEGDARITRIGRILRRTSIDELPQLVNVLRGDMSLVGPRPHAVAHDRAFERRIRRYPRRLNMKPGITGWAQINGLRGETDTDDKMRRRVEADLYYIDNWSILLDLYIIVMTVLSPRTFRNAR